MIRCDLFINKNEEDAGYALILMDCQMPEMDGFECTREIRNIFYDENRKQPVITGVTGHLEQECVDQALAAGMNQVLSKPVKPELLLDLCRKLQIR